MDNCSKELYNGDTSMTERICLVIDDNVLILEQCTTYNFLGGRIKKKYYDKRVGMNALSELREELGITIKKGKRKVRVLSWQMDKQNCLRLLVYCNVDKGDLCFGQSTFRWETINFTLLSLNGDIEQTDKLGKYLEDKIKEANQPCVTHVKITDDKRIVPVTAPVNTSNYITKLDTPASTTPTYIVRLATNPQLTQNERSLLRQINKDILGFDDEKYQFTADYICRYHYISTKIYHPRFTISRQFFDNHLFNIYKTKATYQQLISHLYKTINTKRLSGDLLDCIDSKDSRILRNAIVTYL